MKDFRHLYPTLSGMWALNIRPYDEKYEKDKVTLKPWAD